MNFNMKKEFQINSLLKEAHRWHTAIKLWQNHLSFLKARLLAIPEGKLNISKTKREAWIEEINYLRDSVFDKDLEEIRIFIEHAQECKDLSNRPDLLEARNTILLKLRFIREEYQSLIQDILGKLEEML